jgi:hypothetical protein
MLCLLGWLGSESEAWHQAVRLVVVLVQAMVLMMVLVQAIVLSMQSIHYFTFDTLVHLDLEAGQ